MSAMFGGLTKITLETPEGEVYELDAYMAEITKTFNPFDHGNVMHWMDGEIEFIDACGGGSVDIEMTFKARGDVTARGVRKTMVVCVACGSEWHDSSLHPGTCGNCGHGAMNTKKEVEW